MSDERHAWAAVVKGGKPIVLARDAFAAWFSSTFGDGEQIELRITKPDESRSTAQNAAFHAALNAWVVEQKEMRAYRSPSVRDGVERLKDELLGLCFGFHVYQSRLTGEIVRGLIKAHTSKLTIAEFTELFDCAVEEAAKTGYVIESPNEPATSKR